MLEKLSGMNVPSTWPTCTHTFDFNLSYFGVRLRDGEFKDRAGDTENDMLVLNSKGPACTQRKYLLPVD